MDLQKNKVYRCQITDYTADGTGFAKIEGQTFKEAAVGDQCDVRIVKVTKNVAFGRVEKIIVPSAQRIAPAHPVQDAAAISAQPGEKNVRRKKGA